MKAAFHFKSSLASGNVSTKKRTTYLEYWWSRGRFLTNLPGEEKWNGILYQILKMLRLHFWVWVWNFIPRLETKKPGMILSGEKVLWETSVCFLYQGPNIDL
jgi:hypothetical protein